MYTCPVCGYNELPEPPEDWMICPCCNTMFGYSDENWGVDALRREWIQMGARWGSEDIPPPPSWSPVVQLRNIEYEVTDADKVAIAHARAAENGLVAFIEFEMDRTHTVAERPTGMLGSQQHVVITFNSFRPESSDSQTQSWQPVPA